MKQQIKKEKNNILKKLFIKLCRLLGYEIIDQSNFRITTQERSLNENLSIQGKKSITLPLGETKITRNVKELTVIFRSCTNVNMLTQNKKRLFDREKSEYTFRSLNSIILALNIAKKKFPKINFEIIVVDHNSPSDNLNQIKKQLDNSKLKNSTISLNINEFKKNIKKINAENKNVTDNQISNMSNIHKSLLLAKEKCKDLIYFVEDDYLHEPNSFIEMIFTYERIASQTKEELILCPTDYPYLYTNTNATNIFLGEKKHWRVVGETLCTFLTSKIIIDKYWQELISMCEYEHYPFETPLHKIYELENCFSPIPSSAIHFTNINSIFGLSPNVDWKRIWDENENY